MKNYVGEGKTLQYTASGSDIASGDVVVINNLLAVAAVDIADGETGTVNLEGVYDLPKVDSAVITAGETLSYDISVSKFDDNAATAAAGDITGACAVAMESKGVTVDGTIWVKLTGAPGTIEAGA
jgi:predicted RecA/RadA family phage recombinase